MRRLFFVLLVGIFMAGVVSAGSVTPIHFTGFEVDNAAPWDGWILPGGNDVKESSSAGFSAVDDTGALGGADSIEIQDNDVNSYTSQTFDLSTPCSGGACDNINLSIYLYPNSFDNVNEGFDIWCDYGTGDAYELADWKDNGVNGSDVIGGVEVSEDTWTKVEFDISSVCKIDNAVEIRITSQDSTSGGNNDQVYIDGINITGYVNAAPVIENITGSNSTIKGGDVLTIYANTTSNGVNDTDLVDTVYLYCDNTTVPTAANTDCTGGTNFDSTYPYDLSCSFATSIGDTSYTEYCRLYDGTEYSSIIPNITYTTDSTPPSLTIDSVAGDTAASYYDTANDGVTEINITGEVNMVCRWSASDLSYSSMSNACIIDGTTASCDVNDIASQGFYTRYISCQDSLGNENNAINNLDLSFTLDYTTPTTSDNSISSLQVPNYTVIITEADNVDSDPTTLYCIDTVGLCTPSIIIDHLGTVIFTSANRGVNYLRYNSSDDSGNIQSVQNKTININRLPVFTSASDNTTTIGGGETVNITSVSSDEDVQDLTLWVCDSADVNSSGCIGNEYCNATGSVNMTCVFTAESDSASHIWYAFVYDVLGEVAVNNFTGSYTTDSSGPSIIISSPSNITYTDDDITSLIFLNEDGSSAWYNLDGNATDNVTMDNSSLTSWNKVIYNLSLGLHNITFYADDVYGNEEGGSVVYFTIVAPEDTTLPSITIESLANLSYQDSDSVLVNITSDEDLEWAGYQLNAGSIIDMGNISLRSWNVTLSGLDSEGTYNLTVYANDTSSNQNNKTITFYVDNLAPRYSLAQAYPSPTNVSDAVNCSIFWNDTFDIENVKISENSSGVFENHTISFSGTSGVAYYNIVGSKLDNSGGYTCIFYANDSGGNLNSTSVSFDVNDVTDPVITVTSPNNATYNQLSIDLSVLISEDADWVGYSLDGAANVTMGNTSSTSWNSTIITSDGNSYSIQYFANDTSGNVANSSVIVFSVDTGGSDTVAPVITIDTIANASYKTATSVELNITTNENATWAGYVLNGGSLTNLTNSSMVKWNATLSGLGVESTNTLVVYANDSSDNQGNKTITFYVDTVAPRLPAANISAIPSPANETQDVVCNAYVNDTFGLAKVKIGENASTSGVFENHTLDLTSSGYANYTILNVERGDYVCNFYVTDVAGNNNFTESVSFSVNDVTAPVVSINSPLNQTYSTDSILFSVSLNEEAGSAVNYSLDGGVTNVSLSGSGTSWSDTVVLSDGVKTVLFYAEDADGNLGTSNVTFYVDTSVLDVTAPMITIWSPLNNTYYTSTSTLLNITTNEDLSWAGYTNNSGSLNDLGNISMTFWNATIDLAEGEHNITFYANDTSSNQNQGNATTTIYVDLNNPAVVNFSCTDVNDSVDVNCTIEVSDAVGLNNFKVGNNASGVFVNSSLISLMGTSNSTNYIIPSTNHSPGGFVAELFVYDLAGRVNDSLTDSVSIADDTLPIVNNYTYSPNVSDDLDPGVVVNVNATVTEDYNISVVYLVYKNSSVSDWTYVEMSNNSVLVDGSSSTVIYNASFTPQTENWTFRINATDFAGNVNLSENVSIEVANDSSEDISTTIPLIKSFTTAQAASNLSLGRLVMNNTGDDDLSFNVTLTGESLLEGRLSINYTNNISYNYTSVAAGSDVNISLEVNTTGLVAGLYDYNVTIISMVGTTTYERSLNIQTSLAPLLSVSIDTYSSTVTRGQADLKLVASVTNLGTSDATDVYLNWTLPDGFSLVSGSLSRNLGVLGVGVSGTNTITIDVGSSISESILNLTAVASSSNTVSDTDQKNITVSNPLTVSGGVSYVSTGGGGSGGGGSGGQAVVYNKVVEIVRGVDDGFEIVVSNDYSNSTLQNLVLNLDGFLGQYISFSPDEINLIEPGENASFFVSVVAPDYLEYGEYNLVATIKGAVLSGAIQGSYRETQNIKLIIQELDGQEAKGSIEDAESAIAEMREGGFNVDEVEKMLDEANVLLGKRRNKLAFDLADEIINTRDAAFEADNLLRRLIIAIQNPKKNKIIVGNVVGDLNDQNMNVSLEELFLKKSSFVSEATEEIIRISIAAFERGDYSVALERAREARLLLALERKGNFFLFIYLYWPFLFIGAIVLSLSGVLGFRKYRKVKIGGAIRDINKEEDAVSKLLAELQKSYFEGRTSEAEYHRSLTYYNKRLLNIKKTRIKLRNNRLKVLAPRKILDELDGEKGEVISEIKRIQRFYYENGKMTEKEYREQFKIYNQRLAEIENERTTLQLLRGRGRADRKFFIKKSKVVEKDSRAIKKKAVRRKLVAEVDAKKIVVKKTLRRVNFKRNSSSKRDRLHIDSSKKIKKVKERK